MGASFRAVRNGTGYSGAFDEDGYGKFLGEGALEAFVSVSITKDLSGSPFIAFAWGTWPDPATDFVRKDAYQLFVTPTGATQELEVFSLETGYVRTEFEPRSGWGPGECGYWGVAKIDLRKGK